MRQNFDFAGGVQKTEFGTQSILSLLLWVNCVRLLPYASGQHINELKHCVYVKYGCRKQFEIAVSLNHDVMTSF